MKTIALLILMTSFLFSTVDVNTASAKELSLLKGIGAKKSETIIKYRKTHCFKGIDEIVLVKGIGKKTLEKNRANMSASKCLK